MKNVNQIIAWSIQRRMSLHEEYQIFTWNIQGEMYQIITRSVYDEYQINTSRGLCMKLILGLYMHTYIHTKI